nr:hypothetical protein [Tanacetum cinerariifolium]
MWKILPIGKRAGQRKPERQWTADERKATNLDSRLKRLIMFVLPDKQMNSVINCLTAKSTWDDLILYHEGPSDVKESRVMDIKLCNNTFKFKEDSPDDEEDTRSSHEYLNDLEEEYQARDFLAKSKRFFKKASKVSTVKKKGLITKAYEWNEEEVSSDDNDMVKVKVLMALAEDNDAISKEGARNGEWILPAESQRNTTNPSVAVTNSSAIDYDYADESLVYNTPLPLLKKLDGTELISGPKTIKLILRSKSTFKAKTLKGTY